MILSRMNSLESIRLARMKSRQLSMYFVSNLTKWSRTIVSSFSEMLYIDPSWWQHNRRICISDDRFILNKICVCVCACVCACMRACVCACMRVRVRVCVCVCMQNNHAQWWDYYWWWLLQTDFFVLSKIITHNDYSAEKNDLKITIRLTECGSSYTSGARLCQSELYATLDNEPPDEQIHTRVGDKIIIIDYLWWPVS